MKIDIDIDIKNFTKRGQNSLSARTGQPGQDIWDRTAGTGHLSQGSHARTAGKDSHDRTAGEDNQDRTS